MADTYTDVLGLTKPESGVTSGWDTKLNNNFGYIDALLAPQNAYYVSPAFTTSALGNSSATDRRHFDTIQAAITAAQNQDLAWGENQAANVIMIYPGTYAENITIAGNVALVGVAPNRYRAESRFGAKLVGTTDTQSPIFTISPQDGVVSRVYLSGLNIDPQYNATTTDGVEIDNALILDIEAQASYDSVPNTLVLDRCDIMASPRGTNNLWSAGIRARGWAKVGVYNSQFRFQDHGATANRGISSVFDVIGINNTTGRSILQLSRVDIQHNYRAGTDPTSANIFSGDYIYTSTDRCSFFHPDGSLYADGGNGTANFWLGLTNEDMALRGNIDGLDAVYF